MTQVYVNVYIGQTRAAGWIRMLEGYGFGEMTVRSEVPARRHPYAFDNGAYKDWNVGRPKGISDLMWLKIRGPLRRHEFNEKKYQGALDYLHLHSNIEPAFMVVPDLVAGGAESLRFSLEWVERLPKRAPKYLVLQDGMGAEISDVLHKFDGLFVGGSVRWKMKTAKQWVEFAHDNALPCHIGRMGTEHRARAAIRWGAESIDSALPLWSEANLRRFLRGFNPALTAEMFPEAA